MSKIIGVMTWPFSKNDLFAATIGLKKVYDLSVDLKENAIMRLVGNNVAGFGIYTLADCDARLGLRQSPKIRLFRTGNITAAKGALTCI